MNEPDLLTIEIFVFEDALPCQPPQPPSEDSKLLVFPPELEYNSPNVNMNEIQSTEKRNIFTSC